MPTGLFHEGGDTYRLEISGRLEQPDYAHAAAEMATAVTKAGTIRLLCLLQGFEGFGKTRPGADLSFYAAHGDKITRIAIVGTEPWRHQSLMFAVADLRKAPVQFFLDTDLVKARKWLAA